jgi:hypothetical protein
MGKSANEQIGRHLHCAQAQVSANRSQWDNKGLENCHFEDL